MWKSILLSIISGLLLAVAWPTHGFAGLLFIAFIPILIIEKQFTDAPFGHKKLKIFLLSYLTFIIWNAIAYSWLANAKPQINPSPEEIQQAWFAYLSPVLLNSLFMAIIFLTYHLIRSKQGDFYGFVFLPCMWMTFEKLHLNWDFSWPWLNLGNGFASYYKWIQWYEITGIFGGTLWIWISNLVLFKAINTYLEQGDKKKIKKYGIAFLSIVIFPILISYIMYYTYEEKGEEIEVAVVQPKLNPYREKYTKPGQVIVNEITSLSDAINLKNTDVLITPETSFPGSGQLEWNDIENDKYIIQFRNWISQYPNLVLIAGTDISEFTTSSTPPNNTAIPIQPNLWVNRYNSVIQIENGERNIQKYDKSKLVVGVEYFPYPNILKPILGDLMLNFGGSTNSLTKSKEQNIFTNQHNDAKVSPLICYESIYGEFTADFVKKGANLITVSTNDSWWGNTDGHKQFLDYTRLRAIENRRYISRSANSGVSAFINQRGDIIKSLEYDTKGAAKLKVKLNNVQTYYTFSGDLIARIALLISSILLAFYLAENIIKKKNS